MNIVAVTACPTGIAHTYMAAEQLEKTARKLGHHIKVETQGAMGIENELSAGDIADAQVAIFAADIRGAAQRALRKTEDRRGPGAGSDQEPRSPVRPPAGLGFRRP